MPGLPHLSMIRSPPGSAVVRVARPAVCRAYHGRRQFNHGWRMKTEMDAIILAAGARSLHDEALPALEKLGKAARQQGPLDDKTAHLIQLAAAAAIQSEGAVHSHVKRATAAGATPEEIYQADLLLVSTIGFSKVAATICWVDDVLKQEEQPEG